MGRGRGKGGKGRKGKGHGQSSEQSEAAKQHAAEINARRRAEGKETRSTGSIARSQRRAQAHHAAKSKADPATDCGRSRSPVREAAPKPAAASSSYEDTEEEAVAGEFLPAGPKAKAGTQLQEPSQPSVLPATAATARRLSRRSREPRHPGPQPRRSQPPPLTGAKRPRRRRSTAAQVSLSLPLRRKATAPEMGRVSYSLAMLWMRHGPSRPQPGQRQPPPGWLYPTTNTQANRRKKCRHFKAHR